MTRPDLHARFLLVCARERTKYAAHLEHLRRSGGAPPSEFDVRQHATRQHRKKIVKVVLVGWSFVLLSWFQAPWGTGGWYVSSIGGFGTKKDCEEAAAWVQKTAGPRPVIPSRCFEEGR